MSYEQIALLMFASMMVLLTTGQRVFAAIGFVLLGIVLAVMMRGGSRPSDAAARARRRAELLEAARELEEDFEAGEIGPAFRQKRRQAIVRELAVLLHQDDAAGPSKAPRSKGTASSRAAR